MGGDAEPLPFDRGLERLIELRGDSHVLRSDSHATSAAHRSAVPSVAPGLDAIAASLDGGALSRLSRVQKAATISDRASSSPGQTVWRDQAAARIANGLVLWTATPRADQTSQDDASARIRGQLGNVVVNLQNQIGTPHAAVDSAPRFDGEKMVIDIVTKAANQPGPARPSPFRTALCS